MTFKFGPSHLSLVIGHFLLSRAPNWCESEGKERKGEDGFGPAVKSWKS